ncbi:MAG: rhodanese-like domain-containing protein [SAR202 cluster bacterium]|nr:rhodanese-like domain-containing protein [SAR202 cluster bacterium]
MQQRPKIVEPFGRISVDEAKQRLDRGDNCVVIDVRKPNEFQAGHVPGAKLIPVDDVLKRYQEIPRDKDVLFVCGVGQRSALACEYAAALGLTRIFNIEGGTEAWIKRGYAVEK